MVALGSCPGAEADERRRQKEQRALYQSKIKENLFLVAHLPSDTTLRVSTKSLVG